MEKIAQRLDARHLLIALLLGLFFAATAITASWAYAEPYSLTSNRRVFYAPHPSCTRHYAGDCSLDNPCYRADLRNWRYGDERDFSCFIYQQN